MRFNVSVPDTRSCSRRSSPSGTTIARPAGRTSAATTNMRANEFWSTILRCPLPQAVLIAAYRVFSQAKFIARQRGLPGLVREPVWWLQAFRGLPYFWGKRKPLPWRRYRQWLSLP